MQFQIKFEILFYFPFIEIDSIGLLLASWYYYCFITVALLGSSQDNNAFDDGQHGDEDVGSANIQDQQVFAQYSRPYYYFSRRLLGYSNRQRRSFPSNYTGLQLEIISVGPTIR